LALDSHIILVQQIKASNRKAFQKLYESCWQDLFISAFHLIACEELAKDFTQDAFVKLWENRDKINSFQSPKPYLYTILKNSILNHIRKEKTLAEKKIHIVAHTAHEIPSPVEQLAAKELESKMLAIIRELPPAAQRIWNLSRQENLSVNEIAGRLEISPLTVKKQLSNVLRALRARFAAHLRS